MKKTFLLFCAVLLFVSAQAQERVKQQELGLSFIGFNNFGLAYRFGHQHAMWRVGSTFINGSSDTYFDYNAPGWRAVNKRLGVGLSFGREYRKLFAKDFEFRYGADLSFYSVRNRESQTGHLNQIVDFSRLRTTFAPGINLVLGINYVLWERFVFGAELLPGASYRFEAYNPNTLPGSETTTIRWTGYSFGISSSSAILTAMYRF